MSYFFIDRGLWSKSSDKRGKILKKQTELLERYYAQSKNFVIPFRSDLKIDGVDPFKYNKLTYLNQICFNGWIVNSTHNESKIQTFKSFGHNASVFVSNNDTIVVKSIIESSFKNYGVILKANVEIKDEQNQIVSFFKIP